MTKRTAKTKPASPTVAVGYLYGEHVAAGFANSLAAMLWHQARGGVVTEVFPEASGVNISHGRNNLVRATLASSCEWLLMLDADMTFRADLPNALLARAHPSEAPIVGALCFGVDNERLFPTLYDFTEQDGRLQTIRYEAYPQDELFRVGATGAAALLIHRDALTAIGAAEFDAVWPWFQETAVAGQRFGEDMTFCLRAAACGIPVHVDTSVAIGHQKASVLTEARFVGQRDVMAAPTAPITAQ
jgi:GT2 family glycosyltransferase